MGKKIKFCWKHFQFYTNDCWYCSVRQLYKEFGQSLDELNGALEKEIAKRCQQVY